MIKLASGCAAVALVLGGCATSIDSANNQALDAIADEGASSYIVDIDNNPLMAGGGGCLRSIHWQGDVGQACGGAPVAAVEEVKPEPIVEVPASSQPILSETLNGNAMFELDSSELSWEGMQSLEKLIAQLGAVNGGSIEVVGHTDDTGSAEYNQQLSTMRAENVRSYIEARIQGFEVTSSAQGELSPVADNATAEGRAQNRRVDVLVRTSPAVAQ
jgi:outer membrane protein OmpA-like peptidoglycan-associated protein